MVMAKKIVFEIIVEYDCTTPVSYTHLDVYKRQLPQCRPAWNLPRNNVNKPGHCDRRSDTEERRSCSVRSLEAEWRAKIRRARAVGLRVAVSYTHLLPVNYPFPLTDLHQNRKSLRPLQFRAVCKTLFDSV